MAQNNEKPSATGSGFFRSDRPKWWTQQLESSWQHIREAVTQQVQKIEGVTKKWEDRLTEEALAFGHGARQRFQRFRVWEAALEEQLKAEWQQLKGKNVKWESVRDAVKHAWEHAKTIGTPPQAGEQGSGTPGSSGPHQ